MKKILILPDLHLPYTDWNVLRKIAKFAKKYKPDYIVQLGDLIDAKAWSRWPKDPDDDSAQEEWNKVMKAVDKLHKLFPKLIILSGNHDRRPMAKALEAGLPEQLVNTLDKVFKYKGWKWHVSSEPFELEGMIFIHGDELAGTVAQKAAKLGKSVIQGHTHKGSLTYVDTFQHEVFGMECGCIVDKSTIAFRYSARNPMTCFIGFALIDNQGPRLISAKTLK